MEEDLLDPPVHLYIKTHRVTGLKYFGRTIQDPFKYLGSGVHWTRHLKVHGDDVETKIYGTYTSRELLVSDAVEFSLRNDIVRSKGWANMVIETGERSVIPGTTCWDRKFTFTGDELQNLINEELTPSEIADKLGCSLSYVYTRVREEGITLNKRVYPMGPRKVIDFESLVHEYLTTSISHETLAAKYAVSSSTVRNILRNRGIATRRKHQIEDPELVVRLYLAGESTVSLGKKFNVPRGVISELLHSLGAARTNGRRHEIAQDALYELRIVQGLPKQRIAKILGVDRKAVYRALEEFGFE